MKRCSDGDPDSLPRQPLPHCCWPGAPGPSDDAGGPRRGPRPEPRSGPTGVERGARRPRRARNRGRAGGPEAAARGGDVRRPPDARALHALGPHRRRHRRLPLLPARPEAGRGRLPHRGRRAPGQPGRRPPRDPVPGPARRGRRGRSRPTRPARARAGPASAAPASARPGESLDSAPWIGAWAPGWRRHRAPQGLRHPARRRHPGDHAGPLQPARRRRARHQRRPAPAGARDRPDEVARDGAAARARRAALPARQDRQAVRP